MTIISHPRAVDELRELLEQRVGEKPVEVRAALSQAEEVIVFGSVACGVDGPDSDLDVLALNGGRRARSRSLDLVCLDKARTRQRWWLGGELAGHVATYGVWLRGVPAWCDAVFVSDWSIRKKSARILTLLGELYVRRSILSAHHVAQQAERVILELARLERLQRRAFIPTTDELRDALLDNDFAVLDTVAALLGHPPCLMLKEILAEHWNDSPRRAVAALFRDAWTRRLAEAQAWREQGRP